MHKISNMYIHFITPTFKCSDERNYTYRDEFNKISAFTHPRLALQQQWQYCHCHCSLFTWKRKRNTLRVRSGLKSHKQDVVKQSLALQNKAKSPIVNVNGL